MTGGGGSLLGRWNGQEDLGCLPLVGVQYLASHLSPRYEYGPDSEVVGAGGLFECPGAQDVEGQLLAVTITVFPGKACHQRKT